VAKNLKEKDMSNRVGFNKNYPVIEESNHWYERGLGLIPSLTQTLAKGPTQYVQGVSPIYLARGKGSHVWDVDGNEYIDYNMGIGPISLGYAYPEVDAAIRRQLEDGITFSLVHPLEVEVAELLRQVIPNAEAVRYSKTGADVTSAAIRVARAFTDKNKILCCGYHGWHDWYSHLTPRKGGIPKAVQDLTFTFNYNDIESLEEAIDRDTAAVILEPVVFEAPRGNFLQRVAEVCRTNDIILIFDEMWTGFRIALGGAQEYFNVTPDLATYSKAIANGMPVSVIAGRKEIMDRFDEDVFFFTTFGGEALSLAAVKATIAEIRDKNVPQFLEQQGQKLIQGYNQIAQSLDISYTRCSGYGFRSLVSFDESAGNPLEIKSLVQQEMIKRGILWSGFHNMCFSHSDKDIDYTLDVYRDVLPLLKKAVIEGNVFRYLLGRPVQPVFRKTSGFNTKPGKKNE
jgi:glutamate-1-semialdehyde 2,1-aminomutase